MDRDGVHTGGIKPDNPMQLPPSVGNRLVPGFLPRPEAAAEKRAADLRQLHREAALSALSGISHNPDLSASEHARYAIAAADEFVRQYNPDAVIAEVMG